MIEDVKEELFPCNYPGCKVMRTEAEGGNIFTVCDEHWELLKKEEQKNVC
jgi:hypothetical protein